MSVTPVTGKVATRSILVAALLAASALAAPNLASAQTAPAEAPKATPGSFNQIVRQRIQPQTETLLVQLVKDGRKTVIDGQPVFNGADKFLPGKIAIGLVDFLVTLPPDDPRLPKYLADFRAIAKMTVDDTNDTWGAYYYLAALNKLREAGHLKAAVDPLTMAKLRVRLDWRSFVDADSYELIDHPNNYYCVALGIARLRARMGWESNEASEKLFAKIAHHYDAYSGPYGFADETEGDGRFDRYSVLLAGEIAHHYVATGGEPPAQVKTWLRKSADVMLMRIDAEGQGFEYGRSLGPYGETSIVETLTAAAVAGVLTQPEKDLAYAYVTRVAKRYVEFWQDPKTGSVNLWDGGRRTDAYRGKFRILGENLSLAHQFAYTNAFWNELGYRDKTPPADWTKAIDALPRRQVTWFARGEHDRLLVTVRDGKRLVSLPVINGDVSQHMNNPYYPIPFSPGMLAGVADGQVPLLTPRLTMDDGSTLMPLAFFKDAKVEEKGKRTIVSFRQDALDKMGKSSPVADTRVSVATTYVLEPGRITRTDVFTPAAGAKIADVAVELGSFSEGPTAKGTTATFAKGAVRGFKVEGLARCEASSVLGNRDYETPNGPMQSRIACSGAASSGQPITVTWRLDYR